MAQLPSEVWLIQQVDGIVHLSHRYTEEVLVSFNVRNADEVAKAQKAIYNLIELSPEDKCFAHFWSGYFYAHAS